MVTGREEEKEDVASQTVENTSEKPAAKKKKKKADMSEEEKAEGRRVKEAGKGWKSRRITIEKVEKLNEFVGKHAKEVKRYIEATYV